MLLRQDNHLRLYYHKGKAETASWGWFVFFERSEGVIVEVHGKAYSPQDLSNVCMQVLKAKVSKGKE